MPQRAGGASPPARLHVRPGSGDRASPLQAHPARPYFPAMATRIGRLGPERDSEGDDTGGAGVGVATRTRPKAKKPSLYKVLLLNDDYTPMEFVILVLQRFFRMGLEDATRVMLHVHQKGVGVCGIFTYEVAETKVTQVLDFARQHQHPLQCTMEKA